MWKGNHELDEFIQRPINEYRLKMDVDFGGELFRDVGKELHNSIRREVEL